MLRSVKCRGAIDFCWLWSGNSFGSTVTMDLGGEIIRRATGGLCCVGRSGAMVERALEESEGEHQFIERNSNSVVDWCVGGDLVVAASEVLHEGVAGSEDPC